MKTTNYRVEELTRSLANKRVGFAAKEFIIKSGKILLSHLIRKDLKLKVGRVHKFKLETHIGEERIREEPEFNNESVMKYLSL